MALAGKRCRFPAFPCPPLMSIHLDGETGGNLVLFFAGFGKIAKKGIEIEFSFVYNDTVVVPIHCAQSEWGRAP
ncbi:MAG: hypothetical protein BHW33_06480 [Firmicutes bacterium CAG:137_57_8]|jgi:hypothetical protein|nr:MAG: hypothetical protein BHW33_06480 [Firmicutes bacterium CAG:137_57_8]